MDSTRTHSFVIQRRMGILSAESRDFVEDEEKGRGAEAMTGSESEGWRKYISPAVSDSVTQVLFRPFSFLIYFLSLTSESKLTLSKQPSAATEDSLVI